ncbi:MAG TPA: ABC transporter permease, partial [Saprospiraceae bacterium]|nr:ABC transporter permease [Saprospiraceae bacterium]
MIKIAIKDLMQFFKQKRTMLLTFLLPIVLITLFAFAFGGIGGGSSDSRISLQISDLDQTQTSKKAAVLFDSLKGLEIKPTELSIAQDNIKKGKESFVLIFKKGFADSVNAGYNPPLELQYDEAKETEVGLLQQSLIPTIAMMPFSLGDPKTTMANRFNNMAGTKDNTERAIIKERSDKLFDDLSAAMSRSNSSGGSAADFLGGNIKMTKLIAANNDNELGLIQAVAGTAVMMLLFSVVG